MLVVRERQMRALARAALPRWIAAHVKQCFPRECAAMDDAALDAMIREGLERAAAYGFSAEAQLSQYIDLMMMLGRDFDREESGTFISEILKDRATPDPKVRMDRAIAAALKRLEATPARQREAAHVLSRGGPGAVSGPETPERDPGQ